MNLNVLRQLKSNYAVEQALNNLNILQSEHAKKVLCFTSKQANLEDMLICLF